MPENGDVAVASLRLGAGQVVHRQHKVSVLPEAWSQNPLARKLTRDSESINWGSDPASPSLAVYDNAARESEPGQRQRIRAVPSFASAPAVTAIEALQRENTRLKGLLSTTVQQTQAAIESLEHNAPSPPQPVAAEAPNTQEEISGELQQRVKELEGECEQLLGRAEAAEATVRFLQEQHTISQTSVGAMAAEVQQLTWQLGAARRATAGHKDDLVHAGRTIATLTHQLQAVQKTAKQREWAMHEDVKVRRLELRLAIICSCIIASFALFL